MKKKTLYIIISILVLAAVTTTLVLVFKKKGAPQTTEVEEVKIPEKYGIPIEGWDLITDTVRKGDYLGTILSKYGITAQQIDKIGKMSTDSFNTTLINVGNLYTVFSDTTINGVPQAKIFIYENSNVKFTKYDFRNPDRLIIENLRKPVDSVTLDEHQEKYRVKT
jgi:hypothetical protein